MLDAQRWARQEHTRVVGTWKQSLNKALNGGIKQCLIFSSFQYYYSLWRNLQPQKSLSLFSIYKSKLHSWSTTGTYTYQKIMQRFPHFERLHSVMWHYLNEKIYIFFKKVGDKNGPQNTPDLASVVKTLWDKSYYPFANCMLPCNVLGQELFPTAVQYYRK